MSGADIGQQIQLLLLARVCDGRIAACCGLYYDDGRRIWSTVDRLFEGLGPDGGKCLELGEPGPDRMRPVRLTERGMVKLVELREAAGGANRMRTGGSG